MANEIQTKLRVACKNGYFDQKFEPPQIAADQTAQGAHAPVVIVGTSEADLDFGDLATPGVICLRNLDADNYVTYGPSSGGSMVGFLELPPGDVARLRLSRTGPTWRWIADTAPVKVQVFALES